MSCKFVKLTVNSEHRPKLIIKFINGTSPKKVEIKSKSHTKFVEQLAYNPYVNK